MKKTFVFAFRRSLPILISFFPVGIAYGLLMQNAGYNFLWTGACSLFVLAGSLQFLMVSFFAEGTPLATVAVMSLLLNSRHVFYGLSFVEKFRSFGPWRWFLIYSLCDENYSLHCAYRPEEGVIEKWAYVLTAALVTFYWLVLSMLGTLIGNLITFDTTGIDFALTALFVVILLDQLRDAGTKLPAGIALLSSGVCILLFGAANFILPSLLLTVAALTVLRPRLEPKLAETEVA
ncbi:MAG: AzlC family ABC transporter permease [Oscillospiraceae bacterium]